MSTLRWTEPYLLLLVRDAGTNLCCVDSWDLKWRAHPGPFVVASTKFELRFLIWCHVTGTIFITTLLAVDGLSRKLDHTCATVGACDGIHALKSFSKESVEHGIVYSPYVTAMRKKEDCQRLHAKRRALQRYGLVLNNKEQDEIIGLIQQGRAKFINRDSLRVTIFAVQYQGKLLKVVYDGERKTLASVLPMSAAELSLCGCDHKHCLTPCGIKIAPDELCPCDRCCCDECRERHKSIS